MRTYCTSQQYGIMERTVEYKFNNMEDQGAHTWAQVQQYGRPVTSNYT